MEPGEADPRWRWTALAAGVLCFHLAYEVPPLSFLVLGWLAGLLVFARRASAREAVYGGFAAGLLAVGPQLWFFLAIFGIGAPLLWGIVAVWIALFVVLARQAMLRLPAWGAALLVPFLWTGLEYFRSECYPLRFSWLSPGLALADYAPGAPLLRLGVYGAGFAVAAAAAWPVVLAGRRRWVVAAIAVAAVFAGANWVREPAPPRWPRFRVAGVQLEGADPAKISARLDALLKKHPGTGLVVLQEYLFAGPPPQPVLDWCRRNGRYLVAGGMDPAGSTYRNTAFVVGPEGKILFQQVKSVPIQFFQDGLPAEKQELWDSPWGRLGICICYDLSYARVVDRLVEQGAQAILVPTMDAAHWGARQHDLHARIAPVRAAEYGVPVVRVCSSGISQIVEEDGWVQAEAPFPGFGSTIAGTVAPVPRGHLPPDRWLAPLAVAVTAAWIAWLFVRLVRRVQPA